LAVTKGRQKPAKTGQNTNTFLPAAARKSSTLAKIDTEKSKRRRGFGQTRKFRPRQVKDIARSWPGPSTQANRTQQIAHLDRPRQVADLVAALPLGPHILEADIAGIAGPLQRPHHPTAVDYIVLELLHCPGTSTELSCAARLHQFDHALADRVLPGKPRQEEIHADSGLYDKEEESDPSEETAGGPHLQTPVERGSDEWPVGLQTLNHSSL